MGKIRLKHPRTAIAFLLTALAVAVPSIAWYVSAQRELARTARFEERDLAQKAQKKAYHLAERLSRQLEQLRQTEERRKFYHYQNLYHDPKAAAAGASVSISPLAQGPSTPWITAHFQIDDQGALSLPTLNDEFPELGLPEHTSQCSLVAELAEVALLCSGAYGVTDDRSCNERLEPRFAIDSYGRPAGDDAQREFLPRYAWWQHLRANALYADLKADRKTVVPDLPRNGRPAPLEIQIDVGPFLWHTLPVGAENALVALRDISVPSGLWTQGFVIDRQYIAQTLLDAPFPASFVPDIELSSDQESTVAAHLDAIQWAVELDLRRDLDRIQQATKEKRESFLGTFLLGALAAGLAGLLVVGLVYQSERLAEHRSRFAANAAHELRTPLAGLRLYGEMLAEGLGNPENARVYAQRMASEAERLGRVVTNVLGFTRLERHILNVQPEMGDLGAAVRELAARHRPTLEEAEVDLQLDIPEGLPSALFDRDAITQILQNLLDNAEKYTRGTDDRRITVALEPANDRIRLTVRDNGPGISRGLKRRLFKPFSRGGERDSPEGLGLGLVLVKALVKAQKGSIKYRDAEGGGAMFLIDLPTSRI